MTDTEGPADEPEVTMADLYRKMCEIDVTLEKCLLALMDIAHTNGKIKDNTRQKMW